MPYSDAEKRSEVSRAASKRWRDRFREENPDGFKAYNREARARWVARLTDERKAEIREYHRQYRLRNPRPTSGGKRAQHVEHVPGVTRPKLTAEEFAQSPDDDRHGTNGGYVNFHCRCERCKAAHTAYQKAYRVRRQEREAS